MDSHPSTNARLSPFLFFTTFALITAVIFSCTQNRAAEINSTYSTVPMDSQTVVVRTLEVKRKMFEYRIPLTGKIKSFYEQKILSESNGKIEQCSVRNGMIVTRGQTLLQFSKTVVELRLAKARDQVYNKQLEYQSALLGYDRTAKTISDSLTKKIKAASGLTAAELELQEAELELSKATVRAPITGKLTDVKIQTGMTVKTGDELLTIYDHDKLYLEVKVLESDIALLRFGHKAAINPLSTQQTYQGEISEINPRVDESGMVQVRIKISHTDALLPGMNATALLAVPARQCVVVPKEAVVMRSGKTVVFTLENKLAKWNYVTVGRENDTEVEIVEGLTVGSKAIVSGNLQLVHDSPVKE